MWQPRIQLLASLGLCSVLVPGFLPACSGDVESSAPSAPTSEAGATGCSKSGGLGDCWNPCAKQMYAPTCVDDHWTCAGPQDPGDCSDAGQDGAAEADVTGCPGLQADCWDPCTNQVYGGTCVDGHWACLGNVDPSQCPDAGQDGESADGGCQSPSNVDCWDPCTNSVHGPVCVDGQWTCTDPLVCPDAGPDACPWPAPDCSGSCVQTKFVDGCPQSCEPVGDCVPCGVPAECKGDHPMCVTPPPPGTCPEPDSGLCPPGCPGCPNTEATCAAFPAACEANPTCDCVLEEYCPAHTGYCVAPNGGFMLQCTGAP